MANGGGGLVFAPKDYYGLSGLGNSMHQVAAVKDERADRAELKRQRDRQELLENLERVRQSFGEDSPVYQQLLSQATEMMGVDSSGSTPVVPVELQRQRMVDEAIAAMNAGTATAEQTAIAQQALTDHALGGAGILRDAQVAQERGEQQLTIGEQSITQNEQIIQAGAEDAQDRADYRLGLGRAGQTAGGVRAAADLQGLESGQLGIEGQRLQNKQSRIAIGDAPLQRQLLQAQIDRLKAEAAAMEQENDPLAQETAQYLGSLAEEATKAGMFVPNVQYLKNGLDGVLPEITAPDGTKVNQQEQFNEAFGQFASQQRQLWLSDLAEKIQTGTPEQKIAAANLKAYYDALDRGEVRIEVPEEQLAEWTAKSMGAQFTGETSRVLWNNRYVFDWTAPVPGVPPAAGAGGEAIDPTSVQSMIDQMLDSQGGNAQRVGQIILQNRDANNADMPGLGDALLAQWRASNPNVQIEPQAIRATVADSSNVNGRRVEAQIPPKPELPSGLRLSEREQQQVQTYQTSRLQLEARIISNISQGRTQGNDRLLNEIAKIDERLRSYAAQYTQTNERIRSLTAELEQVEARMAHITYGPEATELQNRHARIVRDLEAEQNKLTGQR